MKSGIYCIEIVKMKRVFLNYSINVHIRTRQHKWRLNKGEDDSKLIALMMEYCAPEDCEVKILELVDPKDFVAKATEYANKYNQEGWSVFGNVAVVEKEIVLKDREPHEHPMLMERIEKILSMGMSVRNLKELLDKQIEAMDNDINQGKFY